MSMKLNAEYSKDRYWFTCTIEDNGNQVNCIWINLNESSCFIKGTLMQIWESPYMFVFI